jgi:hypothetical protein
MEAPTNQNGEHDGGAHQPEMLGGEFEDLGAVLDDELQQIHDGPLAYSASFLCSQSGTPDGRPSRRLGYGDSSRPWGMVLKASR